MRIINSGDVPVPRIFFDLLPVLSNEQIKIYLFLLSDNGNCSYETLSADLGIDKEHVIKNLIALKRSGLLTFDEGAFLGEPDIKILRDAPISFSLSKSAHNGDKDFSDFLEEVSSVAERMLSFSDVRFVAECMDHYGISKELILEGFRISNEKGYRTNSHVKSLVLDWAKRGITTAAEARQFCSKQKYPDIVYKSLSALGRFEIPTAAEAEVVSKWVNELGFSDDMILFACQKTSVNTSRNRLKYCDGILSDWAKKNIKTRDDYDRSIRPVSKKTAYGIPCEPCDFEELENKLLDN